MNNLRPLRTCAKPVNTGEISAEIILTVTV